MIGIKAFIVNSIISLILVNKGDNAVIIFIIPSIKGVNVDKIPTIGGNI